MPRHVSIDSELCIGSGDCVRLCPQAFALDQARGVSVPLPEAADADPALLAAMEDANAYERLLIDASVRRLLGRLYGAWDLNTAGQSFRREVTPELIRALSSTA